MLHNLHHFPPFKNKTMNIILIFKLSSRINSKFITTSRFHLENLFVNDKTTKQQMVFGAMNQMGTILSKP
jgi:hypothetical protein